MDKYTGRSLRLRFLSINNPFSIPRFDKISGAFLVYWVCTEGKEVIRIYVLYLDVYILENILLNLVLLVFTLIMMGRRIRFIRLLTAALAGGVLSVIPVIAGINYSIFYILLVWTAGLLMVMAASGGGTVSEQITGTLYFHILSFVWNKLIAGLGKIAGTGYVVCILAVIIMGAVTIYLCIRRKRERQRTVYEVQIAENGRKVSVKALLDTGNGLREPISGRPVSIIEKGIYEELHCKEAQEKCRVIPYHSIGKEHGVMKGIQIEELVIWEGKEPHIQKDAMIALYEGKFTTDGSYQMILHASML